jgi:TolA-binding protein
MATENEPNIGAPQFSPPEVQLPPRTSVRNSKTRPAMVHPGPSLSTAILSGVIVLLLAGLGAWAYLRYADQSLKPSSERPELHQVGDSDRNAAGATIAPEPGLSARDVTARLDDVSSKLDRLQSQVDHLPKPDPQPDLEPLNRKLSVVDDLSKKLSVVDDLSTKLDSLTTRINSLSEKTDQYGGKFAALMTHLDGVHKQVAGLRREMSAVRGRLMVAAKDAEKPAGKVDTSVARASAEPSREAGQAKSPELGLGVELFQRRQYKEATEFFNNLVKTKPDDARVWYYAALARGLATQDWKGETERLAIEGIEREKAGKLEKSLIDSAFDGLTPETGKEWLAYFRRRAG